MVRRSVGGNAALCRAARCTLARGFAWGVRPRSSTTIRSRCAFSSRSPRTAPSEIALGLSTRVKRSIWWDGGQGGGRRAHLRRKRGQPFVVLEIARSIEAGSDPLARGLEQLIGDRFDRLGPLQRSPHVRQARRPELPIRPLGQIGPVFRSRARLRIEDLERRGIVAAFRRPAALFTTTSPTTHSPGRLPANVRGAPPARHLEIARVLSECPTAQLLAADCSPRALGGTTSSACARASPPVSGCIRSLPTRGAGPLRRGAKGSIASHELRSLCTAAFAFEHRVRRVASLLARDRRRADTDQSSKHSRR